jgi:hypothetical protein
MKADFAIVPSSRSPAFVGKIWEHNTETRAPGTNGIGKGDLFFYVDAQDIPVAFQFSFRSNVHEDPIAMGRLTK